MYKIYRVSPKYQKSDNKLIWYTLLVRRDNSDYNISEFYTTDDMVKLFNVSNLDQAKRLEWVEVEIEQVIRLKK